MKEKTLESLTRVVKENNNNKKVIEFVANEFLNKGLSKSLAKRIFVDSKRVHQLNKESDLICFVDALYRATRDNSINPKVLFTKKELDNYHDNIKKNKSIYIPNNYENLSQRAKNKLEFINDTYGNRNSQQTFYYLYLAHIKEEEDYLDRDLCDFTLLEINDTMQGVIGSIATKNMTLAFINKYLDYCVDKGIINGNVLSQHGELSLIDKNKEQLENNYVTFEELNDELSWLESDEKNNIHPIDIMIVMLLRSGISIREIVSLRNRDFDFDRKFVTIKNNNGLKRISLNSMTLKWVEIAKNTDGKIKGTRHYLESIDDHIIKITDTHYDEENVIKLVKKRLTKFKTVGFRTLNENILITCKKIDLLDGFVAKNGYVCTEDFKKVQRYFGNSEASYFKLKTEYELIRGSLNIKVKTNKK